jgi:hypothetical protein
MEMWIQAILSINDAIAIMCTYPMATKLLEMCKIWVCFDTECIHSTVSEMYKEHESQRFRSEPYDTI